MKFLITQAGDIIYVRNVVKEIKNRRCRLGKEEFEAASCCDFEEEEMRSGGPVHGAHLAGGDSHASTSQV